MNRWNRRTDERRRVTQTMENCNAPPEQSCARSPSRPAGYAAKVQLQGKLAKITQAKVETHTMTTASQEASTLFGPDKTLALFSVKGTTDRRRDGPEDMPGEAISAPKTSTALRKCEARTAETKALSVFRESNIGAPLFPSLPPGATCQGGSRDLQLFSPSTDH